jgi:hypothetical protein
MNMKKFKKITALLTALCLVLALVTACGGSDDSTERAADDERRGTGDERSTDTGIFTNDVPVRAPDIPENPISDFEYRTVTGGIEITGYIGNTTEVRIPGVIEGAHVVSIGNKAFENRSAITAVIIPDSVETIGISAFFNCSSLVSVTLPASLTSIGTVNRLWNSNRGTFEDCINLMSISIPPSVTLIGDRTFMGTGLASINLPDGLNEIGRFAFVNTRIPTVMLPDSITNILRGAFGCCERVPHGYDDEGDDGDDDDMSLDDFLSFVERVEERFNERELCCENTSLQSVTFKGTMYEARRGVFEYCTERMIITNANKSWFLPQEFYDAVNAG